MLFECRPRSCVDKPVFTLFPRSSQPGNLRRTRVAGLQRVGVLLALDVRCPSLIGCSVEVPTSSLNLTTSASGLHWCSGMLCATLSEIGMNGEWWGEVDEAVDATFYAGALITNQSSRRSDHPKREGPAGNLTSESSQSETMHPGQKPQKRKLRQTLFFLS